MLVSLETQVMMTITEDHVVTRQGFDKVMKRSLFHNYE